MNDLNEAFIQAAKDATVLPKKPAADELSELYGLYKQATIGDVNTERPGMLNFAGNAKWVAWNSKKGLSEEDAKDMYIQLVKKLKAKYGI
ncbi:unnamed protein product [Ophioblennius macclurei]